jgi:hypothetical protein
LVIAAPKLVCLAERYGTTTLFAALNMLDGKVIGTCLPRHRHREFLRFLRLIDQKTPRGLDLHLVVDSYATHKTPVVERIAMQCEQPDIGC